MLIDKLQREYKGREKQVSVIGKTAHVYIQYVSVISPFAHIRLSTLAKDASGLVIVALAKSRAPLNSFHQWPLADHSSRAWGVAVLWFGYVQRNVVPRIQVPLFVHFLLFAELLLLSVISGTSHGLWCRAGRCAATEEKVGPVVLRLQFALWFG